MRLLNLIHQIEELSENENLTRLLNHLEILYEAGMRVDYVDVSATTSFYTGTDENDEEIWKRDIIRLLEKYHPDIELSAILRRQHRHNNLF